MKFGPDWWALWLRSPDYGLGGIPGGIANFEEKMKLICPDCKQEVRSFVGHACMLVKSESAKPSKAFKKIATGLEEVLATVSAARQAKIAARAKKLIEAEVKRKKGRPRIGEKRDKPWEALGMSERTYYRRQKEKNGK